MTVCPHLGKHSTHLSSLPTQSLPDAESHEDTQSAEAQPFGFVVDLDPRPKPEPTQTDRQSVSAHFGAIPHQQDTRATASIQHTSFLRHTKSLIITALRRLHCPAGSPDRRYLRAWSLRSAVAAQTHRQAHRKGGSERAVAWPGEGAREGTHFLSSLPGL